VQFPLEHWVEYEHAEPRLPTQLPDDVVHSPSRAATRVHAEGSCVAFAALVSQVIWHMKSEPLHAAWHAPASNPAHWSKPALV
jgi:hypothetical protein